jgi:N-acetylneuraminic acid mutarotase
MLVGGGGQRLCVTGQDFICHSFVASKGDILITLRFIVIFLLITFPWSTKSQTGAWSSTGPLVVPRAYHKAVTLDGGNILVSGGASGEDYLSSCEIYNVVDGSWSLTDSLKTKRYLHTMTLLQNGKVLITGGAYASGNRFYHLRSCELYDPVTSRWTVINQMNYARAGHTATLLSNGKVLVTGGLYFDGSNDIYLRSCELYDPVADQWVLTDSMSVRRKDHTATLLPNGNVLVVGGHYAITYPYDTYLMSCELFNANTESWTVTDSLSTPLAGQRSVILSNGNILVAGGYYAIHISELFNPVSMTWSTTGSLRVGRNDHSVTLLPNGNVLAVGDQTKNNRCELYNPTERTWVLTDSLRYDVFDHSSILLNNNKVLVSGGISHTTGGYLSNCLLFDYSIATAVHTIRDYPIADNLLNAYPNPFNPSTTIRYEITERKKVTLTIHNTLGQQVATLVQGQQEAGSYDVKFDGSGLASGVYFYRLQAGSFLATKKLLLVR